MQVSFQGINNIKVVGRAYKDGGLYRAVNGQMKSGKMNYGDYNIKCTLTDDAEGNDYLYFQEQLSKCKLRYQMHCVDNRNPNVVEFSLLKRSTIDSMQESTVLSIKDYEIMMEGVKVVPLVEFIANLTRKIMRKPELSNKDKKIVQFVNEQIEKKL